MYYTIQAVLGIVKIFFNLKKCIFEKYQMSHFVHPGWAKWDDIFFCYFTGIMNQIFNQKSLQHDEQVGPIFEDDL